MISLGLPRTAGLVRNPAEVVLVRMCEDCTKPLTERCAYRSIIDARIRIGCEDGSGAYSQGLGPSMARSVLMNVSQIATYAEAKRQLMKQLVFEDNIGTHVAVSVIAGTVATTVCAPVDVLKSRFQSASSIQGIKQVSLLQYVVETMRKESLRFLMKGWTPAWLRLAPNTVLMFVFIGKLKAFFVQ
ncbi:mitochondrial carrier [Lindgomyces ingoldianus]|uniref:Mitochondrial carrier n=1 Tax=Lindgomyces ingoldianus TaxID=673940 RepID=A0ACB6QUK2_9PLEO|nr:mitochondrial carrier [Lindgomyces ingoldianus]KAF2469745.1 mitochondrial carrier [Lindgomyces ingoldianus]